MSGPVSTWPNPHWHLRIKAEHAPAEMEFEHRGWTRGRRRQGSAQPSPPLPTKTLFPPPLPLF